MTLETIFEKFDQLADPPNAIAKMRELVLELAMRGRLTVQDETDEPASELLKRIWLEKARLDPRSKAIDGDGLSHSGNNKFPIPANWRWTGAVTPAVVISDLGKKVQTKDVLESGKYPVVDQGKAFVRGFCNWNARPLLYQLR
jgi:type I restriction enzyme, S subunit